MKSSGDNGGDSCNVARFLPDMAREYPAEVAVRLPLRKRKVLEYQDINYRNLEIHSRAVVSRMRQGGFREGDRVLLMVKPGLELILITFAMFRMGVIPVLIDPGMGLKQFLGCVQRIQPNGLIGIPLANVISRVFNSSFRTIQRRISVGRKFLEKLPAAEDAPESCVIRHREDTAAVLFTSGSTGPAKGVRYEHGQFDAQVRLIRNYFQIQPGEVDLPMLPVFALFNPAMGMTTVVPEMNPSKPASVDPAKIVETIKQAGVTNSFGSPALWWKIARYCEMHGVELPSLRRVLIAGASAPPSLMTLLKKALVNGEIYSPYGATESLPVAVIDSKTVLGYSGTLTEQGFGTCVGKPLQEVRVRILPIETEAEYMPEPLKQGEIGEIVVCSECTTTVYENDEAATARAKIRDESGDIWHRMGDAGYIDKDGLLWFCGRVAELVKTGKETLYPDMIEGVVNTHPEVYRSALIGLGDPPGQEPALVVEPLPGINPDTEELRQWANERLSCRIEHVFIKREFPVDVRHNAKIHRASLAREFSAK